LRRKQMIESSRKESEMSAVTYLPMSFSFTLHISLIRLCNIVIVAAST